MLRNYMWFGVENHYRARVRWCICSLHYKFGGLLFLDLETTTEALLGNSFIYSLKLGESGLKLCYDIEFMVVSPPNTIGLWCMVLLPL